MQQLSKKIVIAVSLMALILIISGCESTVTGSATVKPQCSDGFDNDADGYCDFLSRTTRCKDGSTPGDVHCVSKDDNKEAPDCNPSPEQCDGYDNNCNGQADEGLPVACTTALSCGTSGWSGNAYCGPDGNVHREWTTFSCNFPATCSSACSSVITDQVYQTCSGGCSNGLCVSADLVVSNMTFIPSNPTAGSVKVAVWVTNTGSGVSASSVLDIRHSATSYWRMSTPSLAAGASSYHELNPYLAAGTYQFTATADMDNVVAETNEGNNVNTRTLSVSPAAGNQTNTTG